MEASTDPFHQKFRTTSVRASRQGNDPEIQSFQFSKAGIIKKKIQRENIQITFGLARGSECHFHAKFERLEFDEAHQSITQYLRRLLNMHPNLSSY